MEETNPPPVIPLVSATGPEPIIPAPESTPPDPTPEGAMTDTPTDRFIHIDRKLIEHDRALGEMLGILNGMQRGEMLLSFSVACVAVAVLLLIRKIDGLELGLES